MKPDKRVDVLAYCIDGKITKLVISELNPTLYSARYRTVREAIRAMKIKYKVKKIGVNIYELINEK